MGPNCTEDSNQLHTPKELAWPARYKVECADMYSIFWMELMHTHFFEWSWCIPMPVSHPAAKCTPCCGWAWSSPRSLQPSWWENICSTSSLQSYIWQSVTWSLFSYVNWLRKDSLNRSDSLQGKFYDIERKHPGFGLWGNRVEEQRHFISSITFTLLAVKREKNESSEKMSSY